MNMHIIKAVASNGIGLLSNALSMGGVIKSRKNIKLDELYDAAIPVLNFINKYYDNQTTLMISSNKITILKEDYSVSIITNKE